MNGVWRGPINGKFKGEGDFEFNNTYQFASDGVGNWEVALSNSGILKFKKSPGAVDIFMVGGGNSGDNFSLDTNSYGGVTNAHGGSGGNGGECITFSNIVLSRNINYEVTIGSSDTSTTFYSETTGISLTASSGNGANGGKGATIRVQAGDMGNSPVAGSNGVLSFNNEENYNRLLYSTIYFGPGGGGADAAYANASGSIIWSTGGSNNGGKTDGGVGGYWKWESGERKWTSATSGTGIGAGGGGAYCNQGYVIESNQPGSGGSGIVIIRNHHESTQIETPST